MPASTFIRVDLPAPFSPSNPMISPGVTVKSTWSTARTGPKSITMPFISTSMCQFSLLKKNRSLPIGAPGRVPPPKAAAAYGLFASCYPQLAGGCRTKCPPHTAMRGIPLSTEGIHAILKFKRAGRQAAGPFASSFYCIRIRSCRWSNARHRCRKRGRTRRSRQRRRRWRWRRRGSGTGRPPGWRRCTPRHTGGPRTDASPHG